MSGPSGPCGVWQLPQLIGPRTRYSPRSTGVSAHANDAAEQSAAAHATDLWNISLPPRPGGLAGSSVVRGGADGSIAPGSGQSGGSVADPAVTIAPVRSDDDVAEAARLARAFFGYLRARFPESVGGDRRLPGAAGLRGAARRFRAHFSPPHGECMLARLDGAAVGVVMLKPYSPGVCELNRMYVAPEARGRGAGRGLCEGLIARARELGYREIRLDALERAGGGGAALPEARLPARSRPAGLRPERARCRLLPHAALKGFRPCLSAFPRAGAVRLIAFNRGNHELQCVEPTPPGVTVAGAVRANSEPYVPASVPASGYHFLTERSYTIPNAICPICRKLVFYYRSPSGGSVYFDDLGWPWPKHPCTDRLNSGAFYMEANAAAQSNPLNGETPTFDAEIYRLIFRSWETLISIS